MSIRPSHRSTALRLLLRNPTLFRKVSPLNRHVLGVLRAVPRSRAGSSSASPPGESSMNWRKASIALLSGIILTGAWFYRDSLSDITGIRVPTTTTSRSTVAPGQSYSDSATTQGKRIVAVDSSGLYTGTLPPSVPISKESTDSRKVVEMLTPEEATKKLRRNEESYLVNRGCGVFRYDIVQIPSNDPIEDDHAEKIIEVPKAKSAESESTTDWVFWGVFDGHSGWTTSAKLRQVLIGFVARELNAMHTSAVTDDQKTEISSDKIDEAIKKGFLKLDNEIVHESVEKVFKNPSKLVAAETLAPALSGSCALLAFYESRSQILKVAVTGDSRAVLGRLGKNGKWTATQLSDDQTGSNKAEETRLRAEHPGEDHVIRNGRVLGGLEPTRAFGDAFYKWTHETQTKIKEKFFGRTPHSLLKTPPYVTAEPVITTTKIEPENGDFLVMATDGLWEILTNEEVVGLVAKWVDEQKASETPKGNKWIGGLFGGKKADALPVELPVEDEEKEDATGQRTPIRVRQWGVKTDDERFVCEDKNAATHVVRNALGGKNTDMLCALLTLPSPYSRRYRDDLTVEVVFFGEGDKSGTVEVNEDATAKQEGKSKDTTQEEPERELKAKL